MRIMAAYCGIALALAAVAAHGATSADKAWAVAQKAGCTKCHAIDRANVGPAWQDLHMKYKDEAGAKARVSAKLKDSGDDHPELVVRPKDVDALIPWIVAGPKRSPEAYRKGYVRAEKAGCTKCHAVDSKKAGPAWKDVAAKYKTDKGAEARLDEKLKNAGDDHPEIKIDKKDRKILMPWVLSL